MKYGDYLSYRQVDADYDGTYDYVEISDCDESVTEIVIPSEIEGLTVKSIAAFAFQDCKSLVSIEIPNSVTNTGGGVFYSCSKLTDVKLSNNITSLNYLCDYDDYSYVDSGLYKFSGYRVTQ